MDVSNGTRPIWTLFGSRSKMRSPDKKDSATPGVVKRRSESQRRRRLLRRLATSADTLLRLRLGLPQNPDVEHSLPFSPTETQRLLALLASRVPLRAIVAEHG